MASDSPAHDPNSSSSTLVTSNTPAQNTPGQEPASPFSASFDPNGPTPPVQQHALALRDSPLHPITEVRLPTNGVDVSALWAHRLSASFGAIADQIAAASQALATVPTNATVSSPPLLAEASDAEVAALKTRLDIIERTQEKLGADLQQVQTKLAQMQVSPRGPSERSEKHAGDVTVVEVQGEEGASEFKTATEIAIEELQKKVEGVIDTIKLEYVFVRPRLNLPALTSLCHLQPGQALRTAAQRDGHNEQNAHQGAYDG